MTVSLAADEAERFERHLLAANRSPRTIETYLEAVRQFFEWTGDLDPKVVNADHVRTWLAHLVQTRSPATASNRGRALQAFWKWYAAEGEVPASPMDRVQIPKAGDKPVPVLALEEVRALLATCGPEFEGRRDEALIRFLLDTGVRRAELLGLAKGSLDMKAGSAEVVGKGAKHRVVSFGAQTARALDRYDRLRARHPMAQTGWLWLTRQGRMKPSGLATLLRRRGIKAGIGPVHPHQMRHSWASHAKAAGAQDGELMALAGWEGVDMLNRYGKSLANERAVAAHKRWAPGDQL